MLELRITNRLYCGMFSNIQRFVTVFLLLGHLLAFAGVFFV